MLIIKLKHCYNKTKPHDIECLKAIERIDVFSVIDKSTTLTIIVCFFGISYKVIKYLSYEN